MISHITGPANREFDRPPGIAFTTHSRPGPNWFRLALYGVEFVLIVGTALLAASAFWSATQ